jgi:hypothetical protein
MKEIRVEVPQQMPPQRKGLRLKPAGWLAVGVLGFLVVVLLGYAYQQIYWATHGIETLPTMAPVPTYTPAPTPVPPTPTPGPTPTPEGWSRGWDPVTKREYLVPPPEVEREVREAFNALMDAVAVDETRSDEELGALDFQSLIEGVRKHTVPEAMNETWFRQREHLLISSLAPESPVRCTSFDLCTASRAAVGVKGFVVFGEACASIGSSPCVIREGKYKLVYDAPYGLAVWAVVERRGEQWLITEWRVEPLPQPPSSP